MAAKKTTTKKAAKKTAVKKTAAKKTVAKKTATKKPAAKKTTAKKTTAKKTTTKKTAAKKTTGKKTAVKKPAGKKAVKKTTKKKAAKKTAAKRTVKKATAKKTVKKAAAKKTVKKTAAKKKTATKKATVKRAATKKTTARKKTAKKVAAKKTTKKAAADAVVSEVLERESASHAVRDATDAALQAYEQEGSRSSEAMIEHDRLEATKFRVDLAEKEEPEGPPPAPRELDEAYGETEMRVLVRDPEWVFAYWEVSEEERRSANFENKAPAIRWYDVTDLAEFTGDNAHRVFDTEVNHMARCWYQKMPESGRMWVAEIGAYEADGSFTPIARSRTTGTPPRGMAAERTKLAWMYKAPLGFPQIFEVPLGMSVAQALEEAIRRGVDVPQDVLDAAGSEGGVTPRFSAQLILSGVADRVLESLRTGPGASLSFREIFPWVFSEEFMNWVLSSEDVLGSDSLFNSEGLLGGREG